MIVASTMIPVEIRTPRSGVRSYNACHGTTCSISARDAGRRVVLPNCSKLALANVCFRVAFDSLPIVDDSTDHDGTRPGELIQRFPKATLTLKEQQVGLRIA